MFSAKTGRSRSIPAKRVIFCSCAEVVIVIFNIISIRYSWNIHTTIILIQNLFEGKVKL